MSRVTVMVRGEHNGTVLEVTLVGDLDDDQATTIERVTNAVRAEHELAPGTTLHLLVDHPPDRLHPLPVQASIALDLGTHRDLFQLRRPLPLPAADTVSPALALRTLDPARDVPAWVRVNNRAFANHPDQGNQTEDGFIAQLDDRWVDLDGFLVLDDADRPGELAGFCWTRVHGPTDHDPQLGEIYVIGVDPTRHSHGLGEQLVRAGLNYLAALGITTAMLYVDADNAPAGRLYERLGFTPHQRRRISTP